MSITVTANIAEARGEVGKAAEFFEYYGGLGRAPFGELIPDARPGTFALQRREPIGVVLLITPWNDPLLTPARKMAPALIAGNAVVIKPATETPLITLRLADILHRAGVPAGVLGTVTGRGSAIGDIHGLAERGSFVQPLFVSVDRENSLWREEVFGPVLGMLVVDGFDAAVAAANDSSYGLSSAVYTRSLEAAFRFIDEVDTGQVSVNQPTSGWDIHQPFGGFKESGSPFKEQGLDALRFYTRVKTVAVRTH